MWWECSECGHQVESGRRPLACSECGLAGVIFVSVGSQAPVAGDPEADSLRAAWLRAGMERAQAAPGA